MKRVRFHPLADEELLSATDWYLVRSETAAAGFAREIEHAIQRIGATPERYPLTRFGEMVKRGQDEVESECRSWPSTMPFPFDFRPDPIPGSRVLQVRYSFACGCRG